MSRKLLFSLIGFGYLFLIALGLVGVYSGGATVSAQKVPAAVPDNRISIAHTEIFGKLERSAVMFDHKKHADAYKMEGCAACHPANGNQISFVFPKNINGKGPKAAMHAFHNECIECHKAAAGNKPKTGPVTCNDCHKKDEALLLQYPKAEFDPLDHDRHVRVLRDRFGKGDCGECHHTYDVKAQKLIYQKGTEESCADCHDAGKNGSQLAVITKITGEKGLSTKKVSHSECLNCHIQMEQSYEKMANKETAHNIHRDKLQCNDCHASKSEKPVSCSSCHVPTECAKCHTDKPRTIGELRNVPRPNRGQMQTAVIDIENSRMKPVSFNHASHERSVKSCRECHHKTLQACDTCHSLSGKAEGNGVSIADAYHRITASQSCVGCHNQQTKEKECAGCHRSIQSAEAGTMGPKKGSCDKCHGGSGGAGKASGGPSEVNIGSLGKEPVKFPHVAHVNALARGAGESRLAQHFHGGAALCRGCHHGSEEAAQKTTPKCGNCHATEAGEGRSNDVKLLAAYHNQCIGCHDAMGLEKGVSLKEGDKCVDCHVGKTGNAGIPFFKNDREGTQNNLVMSDVAAYLNSVPFIAVLTPLFLLAMSAAARMSKEQNKRGKEENHHDEKNKGKGKH